MEWHIPAQDRARLRELAALQAEYAALPVMARRRQMWFDVNDGAGGARPPVVIETETFEGEFLPESVFQCGSETGRSIERQLLRQVRNHELIDDDKVIADTFDIGWFVTIDEFGVEINAEHVPDLEGRNTGFRYVHPLKDLKTDLHLLRPAQCSVDKGATLAWKAFLEELLGDVLPVQLRSGTYGHGMLTYRLVALLGMEAFFMAVYDSPDELHQLMGFLRDNALRVMNWAQAEGLLCVNNANQCSFGSSYNFTTRLPAPSHTASPARLCDMWGSANSQETVGCSPEMFHDFCFPYYRDVCEPVGLLYYGCCEPTHPFWDDIQHLPHLKKVSISRWCDQWYMGEALRGTDIVFSRKPNPNFIGVDRELNEAAWVGDIRETLAATRGVQTEFIIRDVYTVHGNLNKARQAVALARREVDSYFRP